MTAKKYISFFFLSIFLIPVLLPPCIFLNQQFIQHAMLEQLEAGNMETIFVKKSNIRWVRPGKEIEIKGKLFDVKNMVMHDDYYELKGLFDEKEAMLMKVLKKLQHQPHNSPGQIAFAKVNATVLFFEDSNEFNFSTISICNNLFASTGEIALQSFISELISPPPEA
jgi:hypothetical protein